MDTLKYDDTSELAKRLVWEMRDTIKVEESYEIAERYLDLARMEGVRESNEAGGGLSDEVI